MNVSLADVVRALGRWITGARSEATQLARDVVALRRATAARWRTESDFRGTLIHGALWGLGMAVLRGPRATILWIAAIVGGLITAVAHLLDTDSGHSPTP